MAVAFTNWKKFLMDIQEDKHVSRSDLNVIKLQKAVEVIVEGVLKDITSLDSRFEFRMVHTGSYYDDAKVGEPDEFDYVAELQSLSHTELVQFNATTDPAFLQIKILDNELKKKWKSFLTDPSTMRIQKQMSMSHAYEEGSEEEEEPAVNLKSDALIIDPSKMQRRFRKLFDKAMQKFKLPDGWEHGGFQRPEYGGVRWHGPATMIQLVYRTATDEFKLSVDVTLGIALPLPVDHARIKMNVFDKLNESSLKEHVKNCLTNGPTLHAIPLYSKMLVTTKRFQNKISWRVSCSGIEKTLFDKWDENSAPKKFMRIIKAMRDLFLAEGFRKTHRRKKKKRGQIMKTESETSEPNHTENEETQKNLNSEIEKAEEAYVVLTHEWQLLKADASLEPVHEEDETTDLTDVDGGLTSQAAMLTLHSKRKQYQGQDISEMTAKPGSGEYYGPKTYMSSIEIKTYTLLLIAKTPWDDDHWNDEAIVDYVDEFLKFYHKMLESDEMMKHFFFDTFVCSPPTKKQRLKTLQMFNSMMSDRNEIMSEGTPYLKIKEKYAQKKKTYPRRQAKTHQTDMSSEDETNEGAVGVKETKTGKSYSRKTPDVSVGEKTEQLRKESKANVTKPFEGIPKTIYSGYGPIQKSSMNTKKLKPRCTPVKQVAGQSGSSSDDDEDEGSSDDDKKT